LPTHTSSGLLDWDARFPPPPPPHPSKPRGLCRISKRSVIARKHLLLEFGVDGLWRSASPVHPVQIALAPLRQGKVRRSACFHVSAHTHCRPCSCDNHILCCRHLCNCSNIRGMYEASVLFKNSSSPQRRCFADPAPVRYIVRGDRRRVGPCSLGSRHRWPHGPGVLHAARPCGPYSPCE
jgi:hypothetical protein